LPCFEIGELISLPVGKMDQFVFAVKRQTGFNVDKRSAQPTMTEMFEIVVSNTHPLRTINAVTLQDSLFRWNNWRIISSEPHHEFDEVI
jgi:hypothetical protein